MLASTSSILRRACPLVARRATAAFSTSASASSSSASSSSRTFRHAMTLALVGVSAVTLAMHYSSSSPSSLSAAPAATLNPKEFVSLPLVKRTRYNHNTDIFVFALPDADAVLPLLTSSVVMTKMIDAEGKIVTRPYTPIDQFEKGKLTLMVKEYPAGVMSKHIFDLKVGESLELKGPFPKLPYKANMKKSIGLVGGGTGITPLLQVLDTITSNPADTTTVSLVFANVAPTDILLRERLDAIAAKHKDRVTITYIVDKGDVSWKGHTGYITPLLLAQTLPPPGPDTLVYVCGNPAMMAAISGDKTKDYKQGEVDGILKKLGYTSDQVFKF